MTIEAGATVGEQGDELNGNALMAPRFVIAAISIAFAIAVIGATVSTVRQLDKQRWHASDRLPDGDKMMKYPS